MKEFYVKISKDQYMFVLSDITYATDLSMPLGWDNSRSRGTMVVHKKSGNEPIIDAFLVEFAGLEPTRREINQIMENFIEEQVLKEQIEKKKQDTVFVMQIHHIDTWNNETWNEQLVLKEKPTVEKVVAAVKKKKTVYQLEKQMVLQDSPEKLDIQLILLDEDENKLTFDVSGKRQPVGELLL